MRAEGGVGGWVVGAEGCQLGLVFLCSVVVVVVVVEGYRGACYWVVVVRLEFGLGLVLVLFLVLVLGLASWDADFGEERVDWGCAEGMVEGDDYFVLVG